MHTFSLANCHGAMIYCGEMQNENNKKIIDHSSLIVIIIIIREYSLRAISSVFLSIAKKKSLISQNICVELTQPIRLHFAETC